MRDLIPDRCRRLGDAGAKWTVPILGGGAGRVFKVANLPITVMLAGSHNLVKPQYGADWQLRTQPTLIF